MREFDGMRGHNDGLIMEIILDGLLHDVGRYMDVNCADDVIKEIDVAI